MSATRRHAARGAASAIATLILALFAAGRPPEASAWEASAQPAGVPDSAATAQPAGVPDSAATAHRVTSTFRRTGEELDRFELGAGVVRGFFEHVGTFGYRRFLGENRTFERSIMAELNGAAKDQLSEGTLSLYWLVRPTLTYRVSSRIWPFVELGPGIHTVLQVASLEGLNRTRYKAHVYAKTHAYAGFEALLSRRMGILVRGRISVPSHRPLDYAQAAIFLR